MKVLHSSVYDSDSGRDTDTDTDGEQGPCPTHHLSPFPIELLCLVVDTLQRRELATCLRVNSAFCSLCLPLLHHRLLLSENGPWPRFDDCQTHGPLSEDRPCYLQRQTLALNTRRLDVHPHKTTKCKYQHPSLPPLPRLHTLRIYLARTWSGARVFHTNVDLRDPYRRPETLCAALHNIQPPTLVVRGATLARPTPPRHEVPCELVENVQDYITVFEPDEPYHLQRNALATAVRTASSFRASIPPNCGHLTIVFKAKGSWRIGTHTLTWRLIHSYATALWTQIAVWLTKRDSRLTVVNCGALAMTEDVERPPMDDQTRKQEEMDAFLESLVRERSEDAESVLQRVSFLSLGDYLAGDEWEEVFDRDEISSNLER